MSLNRFANTLKLGERECAAQMLTKFLDSLSEPRNVLKKHVVNGETQIDEALENTVSLLSRKMTLSYRDDCVERYADRDGFAMPLSVPCEVAADNIG